MNTENNQILPVLYCQCCGGEGEEEDFFYTLPENDQIYICHNCYACEIVAN